MIYGKWIAPGTESPEVQSLRETVLTQELSLPAQTLHLDRDSISQIAILYTQAGDDAPRIPVATGRIYYWEDAFRLDLILVHPDHRCRGYGDLLTRMLLDKATQHFAQRVDLLTRPEAVDFFSKYGLTVKETTGEMVLMSAPGDQITLGHACQGCGACGKKEG